MHHERHLLIVFVAYGLGQGGRAAHPIKWRSRFGGMEVSDAKRLKALEKSWCKRGAGQEDTTPLAGTLCFPSTIIYFGEGGTLLGGTAPANQSRRQLVS